MNCTADLTIEGVVRDPLIAAVMRADRVDALSFEILLRATRARLREPDGVPAAVLAAASRPAPSRCCARAC